MFHGYLRISLVVIGVVISVASVAQCAGVLLGMNFANSVDDDDDGCAGLGRGEQTGKKQG
jgi:hypothetical protein